MSDIESMCEESGRLPAALYEGLRGCRALEEGIGGRLLTIGALVAGTLFSGCAGSARPSADSAPRHVDLESGTPVNADSINELAMEIAEGIQDEMADSSSVTSTRSWQAAKDIYGKLVDGNMKELADSFARTINRENKKLFYAPPCCDDRTYDNSEQAEQDHGPVYDEETGMTEYN